MSKCIIALMVMVTLCFGSNTYAGSFTASGTTLTLDLNVANQVVTVVSTGTTYTFTLSGGATNTWTGTTSTSVSVSGAVLTATATGLSTFGTFNITDSQTGNAVTFNTSGANAYTDNFNVTLDNTPGAVTFNGNSNFTGSNAINVTTSTYVYFSALSSLKTANGNITLDANTQATHNNFSYSGITVDSSTVEITGTGILTMSARGGTGNYSTYANNGISVIKGGIVKGGTTGTTSITGWGYTGFAGTANDIYACGVMVAGRSATVKPTITSNGSNVSITGYGASSTAAPATASTIIGHVGVSVGTPQYYIGTATNIIVSGLITSGGSGAVTINGYGGTSASQTVAPGYNSSCMGVGVFGSSNTITSGGTGKVTITGTGGGPDTLSEGNAGVFVTGNITSGTNADLEVIGYQGKTKSTSTVDIYGNAGVSLYGASAFIRAGTGTGTTRVVGTAQDNTAGSSIKRAFGVGLSIGATISSLGSGTVTVIGYGGGTHLGSVGYNFGVYLEGDGSTTPTISSNGGNVHVEGTGGGYYLGTTNNDTYSYNIGVSINQHSRITAGGLGSVTVIGNGGNNNGTIGQLNAGVYVGVFTTNAGFEEAYISSNGGDITVTGTGGGGNASSTAASSSANNRGVHVGYGGNIVAGGLGNVTINGTGGNTSLGSKGTTNYGVFLEKPANKIASVSAYYNKITTSGGNLIINGTGGGNGGNSGNNYGIMIESGLASATGSGTVTITGQGGNNTTGASGGGNHGVIVTGTNIYNSVTYVATITSAGGNVTVTGTGGGNNGSGSVNVGVYVVSGGLITAGGNGTVSVTGTSSSNNTGVQNQGVFVTGISNNIPATITSSGGNVTVTGTGGRGSNTSSSGNYGIQLSAGGIITAGGNGAVSVTGNGVYDKCGTNYGVYVNGGTSPNFSTITSGGGNITVTGTGPQATAGTNQYGVYVAAGVIKSGGKGNVTVTGTGGTGDVGTSGTGHIGVNVSGVNALISSGGSGTVTVTGNGGGNGARVNNYGVNVTSGAIISSGGAGTVTVNGNGGTVATGATQYGVSVNGTNAKITSGGGDIIIDATEGGSSTSYAIDVEASGGGITTATSGGNITLNGNSIKLATSAIATAAAGNLNIIPLTNNTEVQFTAATDVKGSLYLSSTELGLITAGNINIGNANTGVISISQAVTAPTGSNLKLTNAAGISPKLDGTEITMATGKTLNLTGVPSINIAISGITVNTEYDQFKVVADLNLTGKTLSLSGTYTPNDGEVFTIVNATSITGTFTGLANGATVSFNGINHTINYTSTTVTLTAHCINPTSGGTIAAAQSGYNPFTPAAFTSSVAASGQNGTLEYKWESSTTSNSAGFADIASSNSATYTPGALTVTTWFKRLARVSCKSDWTGAAESNVIEVTVIACDNPTDGGTIAAAQSGINPFTPAAFTSSVAASGQTGTIEYKWESSTTSNSAGFSDIASSNAATYTPGALTVTTWFKRLSRVTCKSNWTGAAESNVIEVTVTNCTNPTAGGTIAAAQSGTNPFTPAAFTSSVAASGQTGTIEYKWQSSTTSNSAGFADIASSNAATYTPGALTVTTWFKRLARVDCKSNWTGAVESNVLQVTIITLATQPIAQPTNLYFTNTGTSSPYNIVSNFTASTSAAGYIVVRKTGAAPSFVPVDGTSYSAGAQGSDEIIYVGNATYITDYAAPDAVDYNYTIYAYNGSGGSTNYLTTSPLTGKAINKSSNSEAIGNTTQSTSAGFPTAGVNVNFPNGTTGSTISATKTNSVPASNFSVLPGVRGVVNQYFTITSSNANPGTYTLILDFSSLGLSTSSWSSFKILKRADATAPWVNITDLVATIANRQTDGVWGKFTITGLSSFSQFTGGAASSTITVTSAAETGAGSLKQAILDATDGDYINFNVTAMGSNTITLTSPMVINKDITIQGANGGLIIDGNNVTRVMEIADTKVVRLERLKIVNGNGNVGYAGGIWNNGNLTMVNCVVSGNKETGNLGVGGILQFSDTGDDPNDVLNLINCTITANDGTSAVYDDGIGGLSVINGTANIYNTIVYGNTGDGFGDIDQTTVITEIKNSCIGNLSLITLTNPGVGNIATNPGFVGSIANATHPYAISNTSPAADAGDNAYSFDATDIRGGAFGRTINKTSGLSGTIDMGAYEFSGCVNPTVGGTIAAAQNGVTPFNPLAFTSTVAASGQSGTVEYKWQSSITNATTGFSDIASSNADTYDAGALTVTTWYKRLARVSCSADWTGAVESNVIEVTVVSLLPVTGIELGGTASDKQVKLSFKALNEHEMVSYTIERSADGTSFVNIGSLQPLNGTQASVSYSFTDNQPIVGNNYYRIKGSSINGQIQYSNVVVVKYGVNVSSVAVVPNPIEGKTLKLKVSQLAKGNYHINVIDALGRSIYQKEMLLDGSGLVQLNLPTSAKAGNYYVKVDGQGTVFVQAFIIG